MSNRYDLSGEYAIGYTSNTNEPFYFDFEDYELIKQYCVSKNQRGYLFTHIRDKNNDNKNKIVYLHRIIMDIYDKKIKVDHINHNPLDNRKCNLRLTTNQQNNMNKGLQSNNTSGVTGVVWDKSRNRWLASIKVNGKNIFLGRFTNFEDTVKARKEAEEKYFGEYSYDNSMKESLK